MRNIKLTIQYDGTDFFGWQVQPDQRTVQEELEKTAKLFLRVDTPMNGSGRTDRGVHAFGQVANFKTETEMPCSEILRAFNSNLPDDISVLNVEDVPLDFHSRFDAKSKIYRYTILNCAGKISIGRQYSAHYSYPLDLERMTCELKSIHGTHDFFSIQGSHPYQKKMEKKSDTTRTIMATRVEKKGDLIIVEIEGNGFLYKMVRNIMGIVLRVGSGLIPEGTLKIVIDQKNKALVKYTAKAQGLALLEVKY